MISERLARSAALARGAHAGQVDKAGEDYFRGHLTRVAKSVNTVALKTVAYLHDLLEDTGFVKEDLLMMGFSEPIVHAVDILTRRPHESYAEFIGRIVDSGNHLAITVKRADVEDHLRDTTCLPETLVTRYKVALAFLSQPDAFVS